jgi:hypothetical protein
MIIRAELVHYRIFRKYRKILSVITLIGDN